MARSFAQPPAWTADQLRAERAASQRLFVDQRRDEGPRAFENTCAQLRPSVEAALESSDKLLALDGDVFRRDASVWQVFRYVCGPPISQEDLWTLVDGPKFRRVPPELADDTAAALRDVVDPVRFGWFYENRQPTPEEYDAAVMATTVLWAAQTLGTTRRGELSVRQENATAAALATSGFALDESRTEIQVLDELRRGTFSRERKIAGAKCDIPVRLHDGRLLALECKVSNGPKNGWKRVNREVGGKAEQWRQRFGSQILTGVVLSGVFDLSCLVSAQSSGVFILWEHDLTPLSTFVHGR